MFRRLKLTLRPHGQDLETFRLVKYFSLTSFIAIVIVTLLLTLLVTDRAQKMALKKSEDYALLLAANLNHQVFQNFILPVAIKYGGQIQISNPDQYELLDAVVRNTIHGFHVSQVNIYDQRGTLAYSTDKIPLGSDYSGLPEVKKALDDEGISLVLSGPQTFVDTLLFRQHPDKNLKTYIPFRLESMEIRLSPELGPVIGVFEITQDISKDLAEIGRFQLMLIVTLLVLMALLFLVLRQIVMKAEGILERRNEEQKLLIAQLNLAERLAALGEMVAGVAHEIRNPLGIISSTAELLQQKLNKYEPQNRLAQVIVEEANRLNQTVTEFLDYARPREPQLRDIDLEAVLDRSLEFLQPEIEKHHLTLTRDYRRRGRLLKADAALLHQVFLNILINAIQSMPQGGRIILTTDLGPEGRGAKIAVTDTGPGIAPENVSKIFNPFFTTKDKGSGLGLSIVRNIIESHQGHVSMDSRPGEGTTVTIVLPEL